MHVILTCYRSLGVRGLERCLLNVKDRLNGMCKVYTSYTVLSAFLTYRDQHVPRVLYLVPFRNTVYSTAYFAYSVKI